MSARIEVHKISRVSMRYQEGPPAHWRAELWLVVEDYQGNLLELDFPLVMKERVQAAVTLLNHKSGD